MIKVEVRLVGTQRVMDFSCNKKVEIGEVLPELLKHFQLEGENYHLCVKGQQYVLKKTDTLEKCNVQFGDCLLIV